MTVSIGTIGTATSFGFGDRIGSATPGHVAALARSGGGITPILAQQSFREMARTGRTPRAVVRDAVAGAESAGFDGRIGADADHLKHTDDVERAAEAGFVTFTIDPSDHVDPAADRDDAATLRRKVRAVRDDLPWLDATIGRRIALDSGTRLELDEAACWRCAAKYGRAIRAALDLASAIRTALGARDHEIELSIDETTSPTSLAEHWICAEQLLEHGVPLTGVAPRFPGAFEKGVDFRGDRAELRRSLHDHAAIARALGGYKLSLHSGSDKLSVYAEFARATRGLCHVKTAGTSYLEALRVAARRDGELFRAIVARARQRFSTDRRSYELSASLADAPPPDDGVSVERLERDYLGDPRELGVGRGFTTPGRQIVHCTYGSVLSDPELGPRLLALLDAERALHHELLAEHFAHHLGALAEGLR